jgi:cell wall assembly regulator SMI1
VPLEPLARLPSDLRTRIVLHGGSESWSSKQGRALSYRQIDRVDWVGRG